MVTVQYVLRRLYKKVMKQNEHARRQLPTQAVYEYLVERSKTSKKDRNDLQRLLIENPEVASRPCDEPVESPPNDDDVADQVQEETDSRLESIQVPRQAF